MLARFLDGGCSDAEAALVRAWLASAPEAGATLALLAALDGAPLAPAAEATAREDGAASPPPSR